MNETILNDEQMAKCGQYDIAPCAYSKNSKVGISLSVKQGAAPLHGLRINPQAGTCGWYLWRGEWSEDAGFFKPLHVEHLVEWCPKALPFLQLPPGWRFLLAPGHEDVWHDPQLEL